MPPIIDKVLRRLRDYGLCRTIHYVAYCVYDAYHFWHLGIAGAMMATHFYVPHEKSGLPSRDYVCHQPTTSYYAFRKVFDHYVAPTDSDVFLDWGSGAGRVLIMAATYPFRRVVGVEYCEDLAKLAGQIIDSIRRPLRCSNIELVNADAMFYKVPPDVTVMYFYNPFAGPIMQAVCRQIRESLLRNPRNLRIVCFRPQVFQEMTAGCTWLTKIAEVRFPSISPDAFAVYRSLPHLSNVSRPCVSSAKQASLQVE